MNIVQRKLIYNETDIHLIVWDGKPCFIVSEISKALDGVNREDIALFLRKNSISVKGTDYDVLENEDSRKLRSLLEESGVLKRFAKVTLIYFSGLQKYFDFRRIMQVKDFRNYLSKSKVDLQDTSKYHISFSDTEAEQQRQEVQPQTTPYKAAKEVQKEASISDNTSYKGYSEFYKHITFMEEFVNSINKLNISPDKSVAFTIDMAKFLEDNGIPPQKLLKQIKKWII